MRVAVVGLDLSLTATGIAYASGECATVDTKALRGTDRLIVVRRAVWDALDGPDLVLMEGYSYASKGRAVFQLGELGGVVRVALADEAANYPAMRWGVVPPSALKKYATGRGSANKVGMVIAARDRLGYEGTDDNQADALWLRALGLDFLGAAPVKMPAINRRALANIDIVHDPSISHPSDGKTRGGAPT